MVNWLKVINHECDSEIQVLAVLITFNSIGTFCVGYLIYSRTKNNDMNLTTKNISLKIKLISMYIFGVGYLFHCGLYVWKHINNTHECQDTGDTKTIKVLGVLSKAISMIYTYILFIYFPAFYVRRRDNFVEENAASLGIVIANSCIWLDALFSESPFSTPSENKNSTITNNITESPVGMTNTLTTNITESAIEKTNFFLSPAMIEFSLMAIDLLFTKINDSLEDSSPDISRDFGSNIRKLIGKNFQFLFFIAAFALFAFTFTVVITPDVKKNTEYFDVFVVMELTLKSIMFLLITICLFVVWPFLTFHFNVWTFVLIVSCFGHIVYHMLYCFALNHDSSTQKTCTDLIIEKKIIYPPWADNIISIVIAGFQTLFILGFHSPKNHKNLISVDCENFVYCACSLLGVLNLGLWVSDSIGEERQCIFTHLIYDAYGEKGWSLIMKLNLPLTIFFRFHCGIDFLEFYLKHRRREN